MVDPKIKARALHRAKIIRGQLEGLIKAIEKESYCQSLLLQSLSIQRSLKSLDHLMLESHIKIHVVEQMQHKAEQQKAIKELLEVYTMSSKR
jgi:DNA-binding FrmR family transcriptional regulator